MRATEKNKERESREATKEEKLGGKKGKGER